MQPLSTEMLPWYVALSTALVIVTFPRKLDSPSAALRSNLTS